MFEKSKGISVIMQIFSRKDVSYSFRMVSEDSSWFNAMKMVDEAVGVLASLEHEAVACETMDGLVVKGLYFKSENSNKAYLGLHDYCSNGVREFSKETVYFLEQGYNVLIPFSRAHGASEGDFLNYGKNEALDCRSWISYLEKVGNESIIVHGIGMGGNTALHIACEDYPLVKGVIVDSPELSNKNLVDRWLDLTYKGNKKFDLIKEYAYAHYKEIFHQEFEENDITLIAPKIKKPVLLIEYKDEEKNNSLIYPLINTKKDLLIFDKSCHNIGFYDNYSEYTQKIQEFIESLKEE